MDFHVFGEKKEGVNYRVRTGCYCVIFDEKKENIAIIKTKDNKLFLPGGGIEHDESHEACLRREAKEEMGAEIIIGSFICRADKYFYSTQHEHYMLSEGFFYQCEIKEYVWDPMEKDEVLTWIDISVAMKELFHEHQSWAIKEYLKTFE